MLPLQESSCFTDSGPRPHSGAASAQPLSRGTEPLAKATERLPLARSTELGERPARIGPLPWPPVPTGSPMPTFTPTLQP